MTKRHQRRPFHEVVRETILEGKELAAYLWQVPDDDSTRARIVSVLQLIKEQGRADGRREMPALCDQLLLAARTSPSPQQVEILQDGFDRLHKLLELAKSGLLR